MAETYQFVWPQINIIEQAVCLANRIKVDADYAHIETEHYDLDLNRAGVRIRIPHDSDLDEERKGL